MSSPIRPNSTQRIHNQQLPAHSDHRLNAITQLAASYLALTSMRPVVATSPAERPLSTPTPSVELAKIIQELTFLFIDHNKEPLTVSDEVLDILETRIKILEEDASQLSKATWMQIQTPTPTLMQSRKAQAALCAARLVLSEKRPLSLNLLNAVDNVTELLKQNLNSHAREALLETLLTAGQEAEKIPVGAKIEGYQLQIRTSLLNLFFKLEMTAARQPGFSAHLFYSRKLYETGKISEFQHLDSVFQDWKEFDEILTLCEAPYSESNIKAICDVLEDSINLNMLCTPNRGGGKPLIKQPKFLQILNAGASPVLDLVSWQSQDIPDELFEKLDPQIAACIRSKIAAGAQQLHVPLAELKIHTDRHLISVLDAAVAQYGREYLNDPSLKPFWIKLASGHFVRALAQSRYFQYVVRHLETSDWIAVLDNTSDPDTEIALLPYLEHCDPIVFGSRRKEKTTTLISSLAQQAPDLITKTLGLNPQLTPLVHLYRGCHQDEDPYSKNNLDASIDLIRLQRWATPQDIRDLASAKVGAKWPHSVLLLRELLKEPDLNPEIYPFLAAEILARRDRRIHPMTILTELFTQNSKLILNDQLVEELYWLLEHTEDHDSIISLTSYLVSHTEFPLSLQNIRQALSLVGPATKPAIALDFLQNITNVLPLKEIEPLLIAQLKTCDLHALNHYLETKNIELWNLAFNYCPFDALMASMLRESDRYIQGHANLPEGFKSRVRQTSDEELRACFKKHSYDGADIGFLRLMNQVVPYERLEALVASDLASCTPLQAKLVFSEMKKVPNLRKLAFKCFSPATLADIIAREKFVNLQEAVACRLENASDSEILDFFTQQLQTDFEAKAMIALRMVIDPQRFEPIIASRFAQYNLIQAYGIFSHLQEEDALRSMAYKLFPFESLMAALKQTDLNKLEEALKCRLANLSKEERQSFFTEHSALLGKPIIRKATDTELALDYSDAELGYILPLAKLGKWRDEALSVLTLSDIITISRLGKLIAGDDIVAECKKRHQDTWKKPEWSSALSEPTLLTDSLILARLYPHFSPSELVAPLCKKAGPIVAIHDPAVWDVLITTDFFEKISPDELHQLLSAEVDGALTVDQHAVADRLLRLLQDSASVRKKLGEAGVLTVLQHCAFVNPTATLDLMAASPLLDTRGPDGFSARELCLLTISEDWVKSPKTLADRPLIVGERYTERNAAVQKKLRTLIAGIETAYRKKSGLKTYEEFSEVFERYEGFMRDKKRVGVLVDHTNEKLDLYYSEALHDIESVVATLLERQNSQETITMLYDIVRDVLAGYCATSFAEGAQQAREVLTPHNPASHLPLEGSALFMIQTAAARALLQRALEESQRPIEAAVNRTKDYRSDVHNKTALRQAAGFAIADNHALPIREALPALLRGWTRAGIIRLFREQCATQFAPKTANATLLFDWLKEQMPQALIEADSTYQAMCQQQNNFPALARHIAAHPHSTLKTADIYALLASRPWDELLAKTLGTSYKEFSAPYRAWLIKLATKNMLSVDHQGNCYPSTAREAELRTAFAANLYNEYFLSDDDTKAPTTLSTLALAHMLLAAGVLTNPTKQEENPT